MKKLTVSVALSILLCSSAFAAPGSHSTSASTSVSSSSSISVGDLAAPDYRQPYSDEGAYVIPNAFGGYSFIVKPKPPRIEPRIDLPAGAVPPPAGVIQYHGDLPQNFKGKIIGE